MMERRPSTGEQAVLAAMAAADAAAVAACSAIASLTNGGAEEHAGCEGEELEISVQALLTGRGLSGSALEGGVNAALEFCDQQGFDSLAEVVEASQEEALAASLGLKPGKCILIVKDLRAGRPGDSAVLPLQRSHRHSARPPMCSPLPIKSLRGGGESRFVPAPPVPEAKSSTPPVPNAKPPSGPPPPPVDTGHSDGETAGDSPRVAFGTLSSLRDSQGTLVQPPYAADLSWRSDDSQPPSARSVPLGAAAGVVGRVGGCWSARSHPASSPESALSEPPPSSARPLAAVSRLPCRRGHHLPSPYGMSPSVSDLPSSLASTPLAPTPEAATPPDFAGEGEGGGCVGSPADGAVETGQLDAKSNGSAVGSAGGGQVVTIQGVQVRHGKDGVTRFELALCHPNRGEWSVLKRYREWRNLRLLLEQSSPSVRRAAPLFPPRELLACASCAADPDMPTVRARRLAEWLREALILLPPSARFPELDPALPNALSV